MPRPIIRWWYVSFRNFGSAHITTVHGLEAGANYLVEKVRVLDKRSHLLEALSLFYTLAPPHSHQLYATLFHACSRHQCLEEGISLHRHMLFYSPTNPPDLFVTNHLINMYSKSGYMNYAHRLFDEMPRRNLVSWTALISGYAQYGRADECFRLFSEMLGDCRPNDFPVASVLSSCGERDKDRGFRFRGLGAQAINLFMRMHREGIGFDRATILSVFSSLCGITEYDVDMSLGFCFQLHSLVIKTGFLLEIKVKTALVKSYSDLRGDFIDSYRLFMETSCSRDIVSWTGIITAFAGRDPEEALFLFRQLRREDLAPDWYTFSIVLKACAGLVTERHALTVHSQVIKAGFEGDTILANALIHAYARCGSIALSEKAFNEIGSRDLVSWNSMLKAYALHGKAREALQLFSQMNVQPDPTTFVTLLSACSHAGLIDEGIKIFDTMFDNYGIVPQLDHYACMVDIFGRAGRVFEAQRLINKMPMEPDSVVWSAFLGSCRKHGEMRLAKLAADKLKELEPGNSVSYVQMSNIYSSGSNFNKAGQIRNEMKGFGVTKEPGLSWVEIGNQVHEFASGGRSHPEREVICRQVEGLIGQLKAMGYVPETSLALHDIEEEHKEEQLYHHSEKLALAVAIMNEEGGVCCGGKVIRINKNIRICVDCHNFMKLASDLLQKEIILRDSNRFHNFKHGLCSCHDYW